MEILIFTIFVFVFGLCIGSFLNVVILRAFSEESIVLPSSKCPECKNKIRWYDNIPVLSYIILGGKCRDCQTKISIQYPIVEFVTGFLFVVLFLKFGPTIHTLFLWILASLGIVISTTDIKEKVVFDVHTISFIAVALIYSLLVGRIIPSLMGLVVAGVVMELIARSGYLFIKKRAFGEGDTIIAAGIGAILGWKLFFAVLALAVIFQVLFVIPSFMKKMWSNGEKLLVFMLSLFIMMVAVYKVCDYLYELSLAISLIFAGLIVLLGIYSCFKIIKITKTTEELTYLPFGPSLLSMTLVVILFAPYIVDIFKKIYS